MSAQSAYRAAQAAIAKAKAEGTRELRLSGITILEGVRKFDDLEILPPEIAELTQLTKLFLDNTQVNDIAPLRAMTALSTLSLDNTKVGDITPLQSLNAMETLSLNTTLVDDLTPLQGMKGMKSLLFNNTHVKDLSPLRNMTGMTALYMISTDVSDLTPLSNMVSMNELSFGNTSVSDLRPLRCLKNLSDPGGGISFWNIPALTLDSNLAEIHKISDSLERAAALLQYLDEIGDDWPPLPDAKNAPEQQAAPRVRVRGNVVDVDPATPAPEELDDQVKRQALARLRSAVDRLAAAANRHPDLDLPARNLRDHLQAELADMDLLEVHFELQELQGIFARRTERQAEDRFDPDVLGALDRVCMVGPGLTLDNAAVEVFEARRARYLDLPPALRATPENRKLSQAIIEDPQLYGEAIRAYSELFLRAKGVDTQPVA